MTLTEVSFTPWPKTPRLYRDITVTEKIDGTNAGIQIHRLTPEDTRDDRVTAYVQNTTTTEIFALYAQSRKRLIKPGDDNAGFARWAFDNATTLVQDLGEGTHFGEWWGQGIQRKYDMDHKRFSLFNTAKWSDVAFKTEHLGVVPVLYEGIFDVGEIEFTLDDLATDGSYAAPGFMNPEGVIVYHHALNGVFKVTLEDDEAPKGVAA